MPTTPTAAPVLLDRFQRPTYQKVEIPYLLGGRRAVHLDYELRLYLPKRVPLAQVAAYTDDAAAIARAFGIAGQIQLENNRAGMCICMSCGTTENPALAEAVNLTRKAQGLRKF